MKNQKNKCPATQNWFSKIMDYCASITNHIMEKHLPTGENVHDVLY